MADKTLPLDATGKLQLKLVDNGDGTYSISAAQQSSRMVGLATGGSVSTLVDTSINIPDDILIGKIIRMFIDGVEFVRAITDNTADTITFADLVAKVAAQAVIEKTGGGKVTITAVPEGTYANDYQVVVQQGEGASADTEAVYEDGVLTITLGTGAGVKATATIGTVGTNGIVILAKEVGVLEGYAIEITQNSGAEVPLSTGLFEDTGIYIIGLGTDANGDPDNTKNTVGNIVNALNDNIYFSALFVASSNDGSGVHDTAIAAVDIEGGAEPAVDATAAEVAAEVNALDDFSAAETTSGVLAALEEPVAFSGGVDEVKPVAGTQYYIVSELIES